MKDKKFIYGSILVCVFLLTMGLTYAYFSLTVGGNDVAETINVSATKLELKYTDGKEVRSSDIEPGWTTTKTITVVNTGNEETYYTLGWQKLYNEIQKNELVIRSTCTSSGVTGGSCDNTDNVVVPQTTEVSAGSNKVIYPYKEATAILPGETHTYTITIEFINYTDKHQNYNQGKKFYGVLGIVESKPKDPTISEYIIKNYETFRLTKIDQTATGNQNYSATEYRYQGETVNNYITFNGETGVWRIIGVFEVQTPNDDGTYKTENKVKIIRDGLGTSQWASSNNDWTSSVVMSTLNNEDYYNRTGDYEGNGLTDSAKSLISSTKWYLGNLNWSGSNYGNTQQVYTQERSKDVHSGNKQTWDGKVGLIYASDYMYASETCYNNGTLGYNYNVSACTNWLRDSSYWTISPRSDSASIVVDVHGTGGLYSFASNYSLIDVRPCVYLNTNVSYVEGNGSKSSPFIIK